MSGDRNHAVVSRQRRTSEVAASEFELLPRAAEACTALTTKWTGSSCVSLTDVPRAYDLAAPGHSPQPTGALPPGTRYARASKLLASNRQPYGDFQPHCSVSQALGSVQRA